MTTYLKILIFLLFAVALALPVWTTTTVEGQSATEAHCFRGWMASRRVLRRSAQ